MRVRPIFWCFLALSCIGVLIFAAIMREHSPAVLQIHIDQQSPVSSKITTLELHLTDPQGLPIERAQVSPSAKMTNMDMITHSIRVKPLARICADRTRSGSRGRGSPSALVSGGQGSACQRNGRLPEMLPDSQRVDHQGVA